MPYYWWYSGYFMMLLGVFLSLFLYGFPMLQALVQYQNNKWLTSTLARVKGLDESTKEKILKEAQPESEHALYKFTKLTYLVYGIIAFITGALIIALQDVEEETLKNLVYLPLLVGAGVTALYKSKFPTSKLWKETAGFFGVLGICITVPGIFGIYEWDWMRSDILVYLVLALSLFLVHYLESAIASYLYMLAVIAGSNLLWENIDHGWMDFFKSFIWLFALAPLVFWMPKLKSSKENGVKEIAFGLLFLVMMMTVTMTNLKSLGMLGSAVMLPILYMFSKVHFKQDGWFITKPIQSILALGTMYGIIALNFEESYSVFPSLSYQFGNFAFYILVDYIVLLAMIFGAIMMFRDNFETDLSKINLVVLGFPVLAYLCSFLGEFHVDWLFLLLLGYYGWTYIDSGTKNKDVIHIIVGAMSIISMIPMVFYKTIKEEMNDPNVIGLMFIIYGAAMVGITLYLKSRWSVTEEADINQVASTNTSDPSQEIEI